MATRDALWNSQRAQALIRAGDVGGVIRLARQARSWRQIDLAQAGGYSDSTISRLERSRRASIDIRMVRRIASAAGVPADVLGAVLGLSPSLAATVTVVEGSDRGEAEDPMRRRTLMTAGLSLPLALLTGVDDALALLPAPGRPLAPAQLAQRLTRARHQFDLGDLARLVADLPDLLATAHQTAQDTPAPGSYVLLASCYDLATEALDKVGGYAASRITADRAVATAALSQAPIAMAASARSLGLVLRRQNRHQIADQVTVEAAGRLEAATGLTTPAQAATYAQMLATSAYTAAQAGERGRALDLIGDADKAAARLARLPISGPSFAITPAQVTLYRVGVHWSLGDAGAALDAGKTLHPSQFTTPERRGRLHTDLARAWWQRGNPDQTGKALLAAYQEAPTEVTARPAIRQIALDLTRRHPHADGAHRLAVLVRG